jgi:hypothetical protein
MDCAHIAVAVVFVCIVLAVSAAASVSEIEGYADMPMIFCGMVTGKDDKRIEFARGSVRNFLDQSYDNKRLIIINHHPTMSVLNGIDIDFVQEVRVSKEGRTLGGLRNLFLGMVPPGALWTTWDDDDIRRVDYLQFLFEAMTLLQKSAILYTKRHEFNVNNGFAWVNTIPSGTWMSLCKQDAKFAYDDLDTREDAVVMDQMKAGGDFAVIYNDPSLYVRLVHDNNTSLVVDPAKNELSGCDGRVNERELRAIKRRVVYYFPRIVADASWRA